ncbi:MAG TPA: hypothetical protein VFT22_04025 [Kofleriaceae bacterium]|nr:hypothetical protein [Kofleriaceae bacterium]
MLSFTVSRGTEIVFRDDRGRGQLGVCLMRTLRLPDDGLRYPLPPGMGPLPVRTVDELAGHVPAGWLARPGVVVPMYRSEAIWLLFSSDHPLPHAVKVACGGINALSGRPLTRRLVRPVRPGLWRRMLGAETAQDYAVCPPQQFIDGFNTGHHSVRQFVAVPLGEGKTVEAQLTGREQHGGIQLCVYPPRPDREEAVSRARRGALPALAAVPIERRAPDTDAPTWDWEGPGDLARTPLAQPPVPVLPRDQAFAETVDIESATADLPRRPTPPHKPPVATTVPLVAKPERPVAKTDRPLAGTDYPVDLPDDAAATTKLPVARPDEVAATSEASVDLTDDAAATTELPLAPAEGVEPSPADTVRGPIPSTLPGVAPSTLPGYASSTRPGYARSDGDAPAHGGAPTRAAGMPRPGVGGPMPSGGGAPGAASPSGQPLPMPAPRAAVPSPEPRPPGVALRNESPPMPREPPPWTAVHESQTLAAGPELDLPDGEPGGEGGGGDDIAGMDLDTLARSSSRYRADGGDWGPAPGAPAPAPQKPGAGPPPGLPAPPPRWQSADPGEGPMAMAMPSPASPPSLPGPPVAARYPAAAPRIGAGPAMRGGPAGPPAQAMPARAMPAPAMRDSPAGAPSPMAAPTSPGSTGVLARPIIERPLGLGAGGQISQRIYADPYGLDTWDETACVELFIHIVSPRTWYAMTGEPPPPTPATLRAYKTAGLPWFQIYDEGLEAIGPSPELAKIRPVDDFDRRR